MTGCKKLDDLLKEERVILLRHINRHKYFQHIENPEIAMEDFINKYMWLPREVICDLCVETNNCDCYKDYLKGRGLVKDTLSFSSEYVK